MDASVFTRQLLLLLLLSGACGGGGVIHTAPDESKPHITWEIRTGGEFGDRELVCGALQPSSDCILQPNATVLLRLHLHAAARQTNYLGTWRAPFLRGWTAKDYRDVSGTVKPGDKPYQVTVSGNVTDKPGRYSFEVLLDGAQEGIPAGHHIAVHVPVTVTEVPREL